MGSHGMFVCCVKTVQINKFFICTLRDGNSPIHEQLYVFTAAIVYILFNLLLCIAVNTIIIEYNINATCFDLQ